MKSIIHIGGNKTASTLLQKHFFPKLKKFIFINPENDESLVDLKPFFSLLYEDDIFYNKFNKKLKKFINKKVIFSSEDILGSQFTSHIAFRLKKVFGRCKVLLVIRNQVDALNSWYISHGSGLKMVPKSYWRRYVSFNDWLNFIFYFEKKGPILALDYWKNYNIFSKKFWKKNIQILLYEDLKNNPKYFYEKLGNTFDVNIDFVSKALENKYERISRKSLNLKLHRIFKNYEISNTVFNFLSHLIKDNKKINCINKKNEDKITQFFTEGNLLLSQKIGIDLKKRGYP